ncbi:MAG TPA: cytochrome c peroxidase [Hyphomonadaceae bacterium]|nr:cytochrome c peroxidase [Hyphomonadaceae bacterium]HPI48279.1 cytochrome c peroxidase [Hyphomonadaceae bacterium]
MSSVAPAAEPWPAADLAPPYPADNPPTAMKIELGRRLFHDGDLSWDGTMSCATCHEQKRGFADPNKTRPGFDGQPGKRNIQTLANVAWFGSLTWGGPHVDTLEHQALIPIEGFVPVEMGFGGKPEGALAQRLKDQACYPQLFRAAFPERRGEISIDTITMALSVFQRSLVSLDSPYDRYRRGDASAIPDQAKRGEQLFEAKQCASCHAGPHFTDAALPERKPIEAFHRLAWPTEEGEDYGLGDITQVEADIGKFRTPGLRNVALSAPYMHNGEIATLAEAIRHHSVDPNAGDPRLKQTISGAEMAELIAFLETLTDQGFITNPAHALPKPGCPVAEDAALANEEANSARLHNSPAGP